MWQRGSPAHPAAGQPGRAAGTAGPRLRPLGRSAASVHCCVTGSGLTVVTRAPEGCGSGTGGRCRGRRARHHARAGSPPARARGRAPRARARRARRERPQLRAGLGQRPGARRRARARAAGPRTVGADRRAGARHRLPAVPSLTLAADEAELGLLKEAASLPDAGRGALSCSGRRMPRGQPRAARGVHRRPPGQPGRDRRAPPGAPGAARPPGASRTVTPGCPGGR